ncbi:hypothetical protein HPB47_009954 [Ixodes persulcatus]|uniref:Uncharacterized protein n=1 Tax=Ixodes persulcatus TaxID=34615 RepID=A0AC60P0N0_IXOPE|nr:hypothetical protein HPB47_009954 [Ixodes persulcatus]
MATALHNQGTLRGRTSFHQNRFCPLQDLNEFPPLENTGNTKKGLTTTNCTTYKQDLPNANANMASRTSSTNQTSIKVKENQLKELERHVAQHKAEIEKDKQEEEPPAPSRTHQNPPQTSQLIKSPKSEPDGFYDPFWEIKATRIALKKNINKHKDVARESLPKGFRRHESVLLRRLQAGAAITPSVTKKWADAKKKKKNPDFVPKPDQCKYCLENLRADTQHLVWECSKLDQERNDALGTLNREDKPSTLDEWVNPAGDSERRSLILRSLVDFLKTANLGRDL